MREFFCEESWDDLGFVVKLLRDESDVFFELFSVAGRDDEDNLPWFRNGDGARVETTDDTLPDHIGSVRRDGRFDIDYSEEDEGFYCDNETDFENTLAAFRRVRTLCLAILEHR